MFFRRVEIKAPTFEQRLDGLRRAGFQIEPLDQGRIRVSRERCAAIIRGQNGQVSIERAGWRFGEDIGLLIDGGFQKFWSVGDQRRAPALAGQLTALHAFEEDLREALGLESLYNTSLGTTNDLHLYDRVRGRESGPDPTARPTG